MTIDMELSCIRYLNGQNPFLINQRYRRMVKNTLSIIFSGCLVSACASGALWDSQNRFDQEVSVPLEAGLTQISQFYVHKIDREKFVLEGLQFIPTIDNSIRLQTKNGNIAIHVNSSVVDTVPLPRNSSPRLWARVASDVLLISQQNSALIRSVANEELLGSFLNRALASLDPYSKYYSPGRSQVLTKERYGSGGIGIVLGGKTGNNEDLSSPRSPQQTNFVVTDVIPFSPADLAGILPGQRVTSIEGISVERLSFVQANELLEGRIGTTSKVQIQDIKNPHKIKSYELGRVLQTPRSIRYFNDGDFLHIWISVFNANTPKQFKRVVTSQFTQSENSPKGLILNLRDNPGGDLDQAVAVANMLLDEGEIIRSEGRHYNSRKTYRASKGDLLMSKPVVVLTNGATASAAELLAAALQDNNRAVVVGSISYGKGSVQVIKSLPNGGELNLTWAHYLTPGNYNIHKYGVLPNICTTGHENGIAAVLVALKKDLARTKHRFQNLRKLQKTGASDIKKFRNTCSWQADQSRDLEREAATTLLKNLELYQEASFIPVIANGPGS